MQEQLRSKRLQKSRSTSLADMLLSRTGMLAYLPIVLVTIAILIGSSWQIFLPVSDPARYQCYALTFWLGGDATSLLPAQQCAFLDPSIYKPAFQMLPLEYPPFTLLPFSLALMAPLQYYQLAFAFLMALIAVLIYWLLLRYGPRGSAAIFSLYLLIGGVGLAQVRYDILPAACTLLCVIAAERRHWTSAYVALAIGALLKIYPLLLLPALFIAEQQASGRMFVPTQKVTLGTLPMQLWSTLREGINWQWKNILLFFLLLIGCTIPFAALDFQGAVLSQFKWFTERPVQVEALGSTVLWLAQSVGYAIDIQYTYGSLNIISDLGTLVSRGSTLLFLVGCIACFWQQWRGKMDLAQTALALLLVFVTTGKIFSPQYLIWLMPLLAYVGAFEIFWLLCWSCISLLTTFIYIYYYSIYYYTQSITNYTLVPLVPGFFEFVTLRNLLMVAITLAYLLNWFQLRQRKPLPISPGRVTRQL